MDPRQARYITRRSPMGYNFAAVRRGTGGASLSISPKCANNCLQKGK